ncbi:hypothetical protein K431DRAFT_291659 [Polychaeton citri CBS 116435]|uniref:Uncharacterized protein n=1 Tax=Polychaeton citri CBS 116435 TaxID=1314669 RepID=A0A9P4UQI5_9PEZI|nr:hypothetical protein K431DRAFT_291659 [Polychaeton citri CBS 116435]
MPNSDCCDDNVLLTNEKDISSQVAESSQYSILSSHTLFAVDNDVRRLFIERLLEPKQVMLDSEHQLDEPFSVAGDENRDQSIHVVSDRVSLMAVLFEQSPLLTYVIFSWKGSLRPASRQGHLASVRSSKRRSRHDGNNHPHYYQILAEDIDSLAKTIGRRHHYHFGSISSERIRDDLISGRTAIVQMFILVTKAYEFSSPKVLYYEASIFDSAGL